MSSLSYDIKLTKAKLEPTFLRFQVNQVSEQLDAPVNDRGRWKQTNKVFARKRFLQLKRKGTVDTVRTLLILRYISLHALVRTELITLVPEAHNFHVTHRILTSLDCQSVCLSKLIRIAAISWNKKEIELNTINKGLLRKKISLVKETAFVYSKEYPI